MVEVAMARAPITPALVHAPALVVGNHPIMEEAVQPQVAPRLPAHAVATFQQPLRGLHVRPAAGTIVAAAVPVPAPAPAASAAAVHPAAHTAPAVHPAVARTAVARPIAAVAAVPMAVAVARIAVAAVRAAAAVAAAAHREAVVAVVIDPDKLDVFTHALL